MKRGAIVSYFVRKLGYYGLILSPVVTFIAWQIIFPLNFSPVIVVAMLYNAPLAIFIGCLCGLVSGAVTSLYFRNVENDIFYLLTMVIVTSAAAFVIALPIVGGLHSLMAVVEVLFLSEVALIGSVLAAMSGAFAGFWVGSGYLQELRTVS